MGISPGGRPINESPLSASKTDNWVARRGGLPPYVRGVARGIAKKHGGEVTSRDISIAIARMKVWAAGGGGVVHPAVRAAAATAVARWEAMKGAADLSNVDLTRHVRTPKGAEWFHLPIGSPIGGGGIKEAESLVPSGGAHKGEEYPPNPATVSLNGEKVRLAKAEFLVRDAYGKDTMDEVGADLKNPAFPASSSEQVRAQTVARSFYSSITPDSSPDEQYAATLWSDYQDKHAYQTIQDVLRNGNTEGLKDGFTPDAFRADVDNMFKYAGYTTTRPMTVYRALRSKHYSTFEPGDNTQGIDWSKKLTPGTTFTDKGIISATAQDHFAVGWLLNDAEGNDGRMDTPNDVVLEIHVPTGTRIVGGDPQFIETMLHPDTSFKIVSSWQETDYEAISPVGDVGGDDGHQPTNVTYTHVIAEIMK